MSSLVSNSVTDDHQQFSGCIYTCGGCNYSTPDIHALHLHLQDHPEGGSYYYNSHLRIAFPKYDTTCSSVQTDNLDNGVPVTITTPSIFNGDFQTNNICERSGVYGLDKESVKVESCEDDYIADFESDLKEDQISSKIVITKSESKEDPFVDMQTLDNAMETKAKVKTVKKHKTKGKKGKKHGNKIKLKNGENICYICNKNYCDPYYLEKHVANCGIKKKRKKGEPKPIEFKFKNNCTMCDDSFKTKIKLTRHMSNKHALEKPFKCHLCVSTFFSQPTLNQHLRVHEKRNESRICEYCGTVCINHEKWKAHVCNGLKKIKCEHCPQRFRTQQWYKHHLRIHTGEKPFMCQYCGFTANHPSSLSHHLKYKHTHIKAFKCDIEGCGKDFVTGYELQRHELVHTKIRPFVCEVCHKGFSGPWNLKAHMRQHTGDKPYKCINCGVGFAHNVVRKNHQSKCRVTPENVSRGLPEIPNNETYSDISEDDRNIPEIS